MAAARRIAWPTPGPAYEDELLDGGTTREALRRLIKGARKAVSGASPASAETAASVSTGKLLLSTGAYAAIAVGLERGLRDFSEGTRDVHAALQRQLQAVDRLGRFLARLVAESRRRHRAAGLEDPSEERVRAWYNSRYLSSDAVVDGHLFTERDLQACNVIGCDWELFPIAESSSEATDPDGAAEVELPGGLEGLDDIELPREPNS